MKKMWVLLVSGMGSILLSGFSGWQAPYLPMNPHSGMISLPQPVTSFSVTHKPNPSFSLTQLEENWHAARLLAASA